MNKNLLIGFLLLLASACTAPVATPTAEPTPTQTALPTPTTVSVTPSPVPTETAVPTPEPPPFYFTEEFDAPSPYWEFTQASGAASLTSAFSGSARFEFSAPDTWLVGVFKAHTYGNVFVRAQTSVSPNGTSGLICRLSDQGWYEFNISPNGTYSFLLGKWLAPDVARYAPILTAQSNLLAGVTEQEIGLLCEDNFLQGFVNGTLIRRVEVTNYGLSEGQVGLAGSSFTEVPASLSFEWISVSEK